jgi:hypothetical protein
MTYKVGWENLLERIYIIYMFSLINFPPYIGWGDLLKKTYIFSGGGGGGGGGGGIYYIKHIYNKSPHLHI